MMEKLKFKILTEDVEVGESINEAQKNIADGIVNIIKENEQASTIGLQGPWGSGKSTIIKQVHDKLDDPNKYIYFYFDAWAHEGDFLRKIFLRNLVEEISNKSIENAEKLSQIKNELEGFTSISLFGIILGFTILFVPFGTEILSGAELSELDVTINLLLLGITIAFILGFFKSNKWIKLFGFILISIAIYIIPLEYIFALEINWQFILGSFFTLVPVLAILAKKLWPKLYLGKYINLFKEFKIISNVYKNDSNDQSSIDFEQYFKGILKLFSDKKFIIVIDNLDRIDHDDAKKIWSTLQIFLQHRNPVSNSEAAELYKNLWIIIPYDHSSLIKIWDLSEPKAEAFENLDNKQPTEENNQVPKLDDSFLDKCFQIRIDVPPYTMNNWLDVFNSLILKASCKETINDQLITIRNIFIQTRKSISDAPTPREIKLFINQFGFLYSIHYKNVTIPEICFYVVDRYINKFAIERIKKQIIGNKLMEKTTIEYPISNNGYAALLFNLPPNEAIGIILEEVIVNTIDSKNKNQIDNLIEIHKNEFWYVLNKMTISNKNNDRQIINFSEPRISNLVMLLYQDHWETTHFKNIKNEYLNLVLQKNNRKHSTFSYLKSTLFTDEKKITFLKFLVSTLLNNDTPEFDKFIENIFSLEAVELPEIFVIPFNESYYETIFNNILSFETIIGDKFPKYFKTDIFTLAKYYISKKEAQSSLYLDFTNSAVLLEIEQIDINYIRLLKYCFEIENIGQNDLNILIQKICNEDIFISLITKDKFYLFELLTWLYNNVTDTNKIEKFLKDNYSTIDVHLVNSEIFNNNESVENIVKTLHFFILIGNQSYFQNNELIKRYSYEVSAIKPLLELLRIYETNIIVKENLWSILESDSYNLVIKLLDQKLKNDFLFINLTKILYKIQLLIKKGADKSIIEKLLKVNELPEITIPNLFGYWESIRYICELDEKVRNRIGEIFGSPEYSAEFIKRLDKNFPNPIQKKINAKLLEEHFNFLRNLGVENIFFDATQYKKLTSSLSLRYTSAEFKSFKENINSFILMKT